MSSATQPLIEVSRLTKRHTRSLKRSLRYAASDIARDLQPWRSPAPRPPRPGEFASVDDVSFTLHAGEALAVVGANGAGKTTLLKLIHGLIKPDVGEIRVRGKVAALIGLGHGFDPLLTGRENVTVMAQLVGHDPSTVDGLVEGVVDFAEIDDGLDAPVRYYSTGMRMRLAFAISSQLAADALLVDEALAVGDLSFRRKCIEHMLRFLSDGGALILVSHNVSEVQTICSRGLVLERGRAVFDGPVGAALERHALAGGASGREAARPSRDEPSERHPVVIDDTKLVGASGNEPATGEPAELRMKLRSADARDVWCALTLWTPDYSVCLSSAIAPRAHRIPAGETEVTACIPSLPLAVGTYALRATVADPATNLPLTRSSWEDRLVNVRLNRRGGRTHDAMLGATHNTLLLDARWTQE